jgi:hypothetical protein
VIAVLPAPRDHGPIALVDRLLRDRAGTMKRIRDGIDLAATLRAMIATIAIAMAIVGAALGSYRGGHQIAYAAIKLPLVLLGTAALSAPALAAFSAALGRPSRLAVDVAIVTTALAYGALLLVGATPLILFARAIDLSYHRVVILVITIFACGGLASLVTIARATEAPRTAIAALCIVFTLVGGQLSWALRPYLVRPQTREVPFLRALEGNLWDSAIDSMESAQYRFHRGHAPLPGEKP